MPYSLTARSAPKHPAGGTRAPSLRGCALVLFALLGAASATACGGPGAKAAEHRWTGRLRLATDTGGPIREWIFFVADSAHGVFIETQATLMTRARSTSRFHVAYRTAEARQRLEETLSRRGFEGRSRIRWVQSEEEIPYWVRDQLLLAEDERGAAGFFLHHPAHYAHLQVGPGVSRTASLDAVLRVIGDRGVQTQARVEGGCLVADEDRALLSPFYLELAQAQGGASSEEDARAYLASLYGREVVPLATDPAMGALHCDLYLTPLGQGRILLGDPTLGRRLLRRMSPASRQRFTKAARSLVSTPTDDWGKGIERFVFGPFLARLEEHVADPSVLESFESVREQLEGLGYAVHRVPWLGQSPSSAGKPIALSWNNVVQETVAGKSIVYMPVYGLDLLDREAERTWKALGYRVVRIPALGPALYGGALRCLTQVVRAPATRRRS